jgi:hypothetical protein
MRRRIACALLVSLVVLVPGVALAGPPLLCFPMVIGDAPSLPWGTGGWNSPLPGYDRARLAGDTVALLAADAPTLARMETLRRAVIYASGNEAAAQQLFAALRGRVSKAGAQPRAALAQFDLGYAAEAFRQTRHGFSRTGSVETPEDGYALIKQALAARGSDAAMEYAAALVTMSRESRGASNAHLSRAVGGAASGSHLARTIAAHEPLWGTQLSAARR